jgi:5-enolpyruvylshikimate-3-phosphate synthase
MVMVAAVPGPTVPGLEILNVAAAATTFPEFPAVRGEMMVESGP